MTAHLLEVTTTTCTECKGEGLTKLGDGWQVCEGCFGVGFVDTGPAHPPTCAMCGQALIWSPGRGTYYACTQHPHGRVVYYLQESRAGYPAGWPLCRCGEPTVSGKPTCGQYTCKTKAGGSSPQGRKP